jgi:hypothetical protein
MPFTSQRLHAAAFNDVLIYRCLWIYCAVLCFAVSNRLREVLAYRPLTAVALCRSTREAQRTRHFFSVEFLRTTVDVISILRNVPPRHAAKYNWKAKKRPTLTNSQYVEQQTGSTIFPLFNLFKASGRCSKTTFITTMPKSALLSTP